MSRLYHCCRWATLIIYGLGSVFLLLTQMYFIPFRTQCTPKQWNVECQEYYKATEVIWWLFLIRCVHELILDSGNTLISWSKIIMNSCDHRDTKVMATDCANWSLLLMLWHHRTYSYVSRSNYCNYLLENVKCISFS